MTGMKNWMLGAAIVAGAAALGALPAQAAQFGVYAGGPVAYVPPCPGPGYVWIDGYTANGYWIAGRWEFQGDNRWDRGRNVRFDGNRSGWDRDRRDLDRHGYDRHDFYRDHGYGRR
ncbi:MAG: hypothetical protein P4L03_00810 [Terracidiphilus sp.]|nr:hypothetical protein [Terracidiphilus sp.]